MNKSNGLANLPPPPPGMTGWPWAEPEPLAALAEKQGEAWPRITVVTPSYNQSPYLEATIRSVLGQGYPHLEYFIMDGGSTDGSVEIIRRYAPWIDWWVSERDEGQAAAINRGFGRASGEIIAWLNSDDLYLPGTLWAVAAVFRDNPAVRLVYGEGWYIDEQGERIQPCHFVRRRFTRLYQLNKDPLLQAASFWTRELWQGVGPLDTQLNWVFDWDWYIRARQHTPFHYLPRHLAYYRVHSQAKTRVNDLGRQLEQGLVTRRYGSWWHPNYVVQQTRRLAHAGQRLTARWPQWLRWPVRVATLVPRLLLERVLHGMYRR
jgi:glycosyltransferase involved in cell wall biosynthesis